MIDDLVTGINAFDHDHDEMRRERREVMRLDRYKILR